MTIKHLIKSTGLSLGFFGPFGDVQKWLDKFDYVCLNKRFLDIGASDGVYNNNCVNLIRKGWSGVSIEADPVKFRLLSKLYKRFQKVILVQKIITPENVLDHASDYIDVLSIDIDGYDADVLKAALTKCSPKIIIAEINEAYPPPLHYSIQYSQNWLYKGGRVYGMSLATACEICKNYDLITLDYNNAVFLLKGCLNKDPLIAYNEGFKFRKDRLKKFLWTSDL